MIYVCFYWQKTQIVNFSAASCIFVHAPGDENSSDRGKRFHSTLLTVGGWW